MLTLQCQKTFSGLSKITKTKVLNPFMTVTDILIVGGILVHQKEINGEIAFPHAPKDELSPVDMIGLFNIVMAAMDNGIQFNDPTIRLSNFIYGDDQVKRPQHGQLTFYSWVNYDGNFLSRNDSKGRQSQSLELGKTWKQSIIDGKPKILAIEGDVASTVNGTHVDKERFFQLENDGHKLFDFPHQQRLLFLNNRL